MRNILVAAGLFMVLAATAQPVYTSYDNTYDGKAYDIKLDAKGDSYTLYIGAMSFDKIYELGGIMLKEQQMDDFRQMLIDARVKYDEWREVAVTNDVKELSKLMDASSRVGGYWATSDGWKFQWVVKLECFFRVIEKEGVVGYYLLIRTGKMTSSSNQYMKMDGVGIILSSGDEIEEFYQKVSEKNIQEFISKPKSEDLFK